MTASLALNCTTNPPHNTRTEVNVGVLSILFSYGVVCGFDYLDGCFVWDGINRTQQKHVNQWRDFKIHKRTTRQDLDRSLLIALQQESEALFIAATTSEEAMSEQNQQENNGPTEEDELAQRKPDALENAVDDLDKEDDLDEDDLDDDDDDEDDDVDFDDEDDDEDDDDLDDEDDDLDDVDDEEPPAKAPLREDQY